MPWSYLSYRTYTHSVDMATVAPTPPTHSKTSRVEDVYDIGKELGSGSFSTVYLGIHKITKEEVALKMIVAEKYKYVSYHHLSSSQLAIFPSI